MLEWIPREDQRVNFDSTVMFSHGYNFFGLECLAQTAKTDGASFIIWPDRTVHNGSLWSLYSTDGGDLWFQKFASEDESKSKAEEIAKELAASKRNKET